MTMRAEREPRSPVQGIHASETGRSPDTNFSPAAKKTPQNINDVSEGIEEVGGVTYDRVQAGRKLNVSDGTIGNYCRKLALSTPLTDRDLQLIAIEIAKPKRGRKPGYKKPVELSKGAKIIDAEVQIFPAPSDRPESLRKAPVTNYIKEDYERAHQLTVRQVAVGKNGIAPKIGTPVLWEESIGDIPKKASPIKKRSGRRKMQPLLPFRTKDTSSFEGIFEGRENLLKELPEDAMEYLRLLFEARKIMAGGNEERAAELLMGHKSLTMKWSKLLTRQRLVILEAIPDPMPRPKREERTDGDMGNREVDQRDAIAIGGSL